MSDAAAPPGETPVHRIGGRQLANLRLKPAEKEQAKPGFSVLLGGTPQEAAATMRAAYPMATRLHEQAKVVASSTVVQIRAMGFEVAAARTRQLANHGCVIHPAGALGFSDENLNKLMQVFQDTTEC